MNNNENLEQNSNAVRQRIEKLDEQIHRLELEIELEEACAFFSELAEDCPTAKAGCSHSQTNFSQAAWR